MNPDIQNKIDLEAEKHALANTPVSFNPEVIQYTEEYRHYMDRYWMKLGGFKSGASFVTGILQPEIEYLQRQLADERSGIQDQSLEKHLRLEVIKLQDTIYHSTRSEETLRHELSEANSTIQSLKDERDCYHKQLMQDEDKIIKLREENQSLKDENKRFREALQIVSELWMEHGCINQQCVICKIYEAAKIKEALTQKAEDER